MILTLTTKVLNIPFVAVHGDMIRCDLGNLILEFDRVGFSNFIYEVVTQAAKQDVNISLKK